MQLTIEYLKLHPDAVTPKRENIYDAGADLVSIEDIEILQGAFPVLVDTGIGVKIPPGYVGLLEPRSSMRAKGITSLGSGVIDSGYRGSLKIVLYNLGPSVFSIKKGTTKIGQLLIVPIMETKFIDCWNDSDRGTGGFGSTDVLSKSS